MLLHEIQVQNFRSVREASVTFGRGLNVLFGPNELGKSTLSEALRAGLLLPVESKAAEEFVPWGTELIPRVVIEFETQPEATPADEVDQPPKTANVWRITKAFGKGSRGSALLERISGNGRVVQEARGRDVEGRLRELLAWGIPAPGGKGAPKGVPESYLTTALLGEQDQVASIFQANLDGDGTDSGRNVLTEALGALAQEPVVSALLDRLQARTREVFTETGKKTTKGNSPLVRCAADINRQEQRIKELEVAVHRSNEIEAAIQSLSEKRAEAEEQCGRFHRQLELSKRVLDCVNQLALATQQQRAFERAELELQNAEAELANCDSAHSTAQEKLQSVVNELQSAREAFARSTEKHNQLQDSAVTSREAKRSTLLASRDEADRLMAWAMEAIQAAAQVSVQHAEVKQADEQLQRARREADRCGKLLVLVRLRDQQTTLQSEEAALSDAESAFLKHEAIHQEAIRAFQTLDAELQTARQTFASLSAKRDQLNSTAQTSLEAKRAILLAQRDRATVDATLARECLELEQLVQAQEAEVTESNQRLQEARVAAERTRRLVRIASLEEERLKVIAILDAQKTARAELTSKKALVDQTQAENDRLQNELTAAQGKVQSCKEALEKARNEVREVQSRQDSLLARRLQIQSAVERARNEVAMASKAKECREHLADAQRDLADLTSHKLALENALSEKQIEVDSMAAQVRRLKAFSMATGAGFVVLLISTVALADGRGISGTLSVLLGIAAGISFAKLASRQKSFEVAATARDHLKEQRGERTTRCLMAQSLADAAQREWNQASSQVIETIGSIETAVEEASKRFQTSQAEIEKIEEDIRQLQSPSEQSPGVTPQQLESAVRLVQDFDDQLATSRKNLDEVRQQYFSAEAHAKSADEAFAAIPVGLDELDQQIATIRQSVGLKPFQPAPTRAAAADLDQKSDADLTSAESRVHEASDGLANRKARLAELRQKWDRPAAQAEAEANQALSEIRTELERLEMTVMSEVAAADRECQEAEANASRLSDECTLAKSKADAATKSLEEARLSRDDRRLRFESAVSASATFGSADSEYFAQVKSKIGDRACERRPELLLVDLAALEKEIEALINDATPPSCLTLEVAELHDRESQAALVNAEKRTHLATERLADRQTQHSRLIARFDKPVDEVLAAAQQTRSLVEGELETLDTMPSVEIEAAEQERQRAEASEKLLAEQHAQAQALVNTTSSAVTSARQTRDDARIHLEKLRPTNTAFNVDAFAIQLANARRELEDEFAIQEVSETHYADLETQHSQWSRTLQDQTKQLNETRGQLSLVGGAVAREQLEQEREALERLRASAEELELEFQSAYRLLEVLKQAEAKHAAHLGNSLAKPVSEQFLKLTGGRYDDVLLAPNLSLQKVIANGGERELEALSIGSRHQLATLIRLSLAAYLQTTLILDDQLAHSDPHRLLWFRDQLRASVEGNAHQIVIITCRPLDYLEVGELPPASPSKTAANRSLRVVDLRLVVSHWNDPTDSTGE